MENILNWVVPNTLLDIGAFKGEFSQMIIKHSSSCKIMMVEPNPLSRPFLDSLNLPYELISLSDRIGQKRFYYQKDTPLCPGASHYLENTSFYEDGKYNISMVDCYTLDSRNYFANEQIDLIKLDTQGSELDIINGGVRTITRSKWLLIETSLYPYNHGAPLADEVISKVKKLGFSLIDILHFHKVSNMIIQMDVLFRNNNIR
jgi:FkbM family methyltransferase